jgi:membrane protease YdiL (CAAX protease family)
MIEALNFSKLIDAITLLVIVSIMAIGFVTGRHRMSLVLSIRNIDFYQKTLVQDLVILLVLFALRPLHFLNWSKPDYDLGWELTENVYVVIFSIFFTQFVLNFTSYTLVYPKEIHKSKSLMGFPNSLLPSNYRELWIFALFLIFGVFFEEVLCRYVLFDVLHQLFGLQGDLLIVVTALLFALPHSYQGKKGLLSSFLVGLVLGKFYLHYGSLWAPLLLHSVNNLGILPLALRRIKELKKEPISEE